MKTKGKVKLFNIDSYSAHISNKGIEVEADTLDNILEGIEKIDFLKIDIEGAEIEAFNGMKQSLLKTKALMIELSPNNFLKMYKNLKNLDFKLHDYIPLITPKLRYSPGSTLMNYLFIRQ